MNIFFDLKYCVSLHQIIKNQIMRKLMNYGALFLLGGAFLTSCGKTTKGKLSGEWTLSSWEMTETYTGPNNNSTTKTTISGSTITIVDTDNGDTETTNGTVNELSWVIDKDGTFTRTMDVTFTDSYDNFLGETVNTTSTSRTVETGSWTFLSGVEDDYKKNERVVFNVLSEDNTYSYSETTGGTTTSSTDSDKSTYLSGENSEIFFVSESSSKELILTQDGSRETTYTDEDGSDVYKETENTTITLTQE